MTSTPAVSVLLPVRNAELTIERAARSILDSTFTDIELLLVNDASTDATGSILSRLQTESSRVRVISTSHPDFVEALNLGISACRAPIIARMDADDVSSPDRIEKQVEHMEESDVDGVGGCVRIVDASGAEVKTWKRYEEWINAHRDPESIAAYRFIESPLANPTVLARRSVFEIGYRDGPWPEDYEFWLRAIGRGFRFAKIADHVLDWVDSPTRLTRTHPRYSTEAFDRCRRMHLLKGPLDGVRTVDLWGAGKTGKPWLRWLLESDVSVRRVVEIAPKKIGTAIESTPVVSPSELGIADGTPLIIAVGAEGAREVIREQIESLGFSIGQDSWFVA